MMPPSNTGSFGAASGGLTLELQAAIQRRQGAGGGATAQVTNSAPTANPATQIPQQSPQMSAPVSSPAPVGPGGGSSMTTPTTNSEIILKAMSNRLGMLSKAGVFG